MHARSIPKAGGAGTGVFASQMIQPPQPQRIIFADFASDSTLILLIRQQGKTQNVLKTIELPGGREIRRTSIGPTPRLPTAVSADGRYLAAIGGKKQTTVQLCDVQTGDFLPSLEGHPPHLRTMLFSPQSDRLLCCNRQTLTMWDPAAGTRLYAVESPARICATSFTPDGSRILVAGADKRLHTWDADSGQRIRTQDRLTKSPMLLSVSSDGERILVVEPGNTINQFHLQSGKHLSEYKAQKRVRALSPDGRRALLSGSDKLVQVVDLQTREVLLDRPNNGLRAGKVAFSPDARHVLCFVRTVSRHTVTGSAVFVWSLDRNSLADYRKYASNEPPPIAVENRNRPPRRPVQAARRKEAPPANKEERLKRYVERCEADYGKDSPQHTQAVALLASHYREVRNFPKAEATFKQLQALYEASDRSSYVALVNLAWLYKKTERFEEAERAFNEALEEAEQHGSSPISEQAQAARSNLENFYRKRKDWRKLKSLYSNWLQTLERHLLEPGSSELAEMAHKLARIHVRLGEWDHGAARLDQARRILKQESSRKLSSFSETEQLEYQEREYRPAFNWALTLALKHKDQPDIAALSAGWVLNGKAVATRAMIERRRMSVASDDPQVKQLGNELQRVRDEIAALVAEDVARLDEQGLQSHRERIAELRQRKEQISAELALAGWEELIQEDWVELSAVQESLDRDEVLIELARVRMRDLQLDVVKGPRRDDFRYAAWIIRPRGQKVDLIDLGPASDIDRQILLFHRAMAVTPHLLARGADHKDLFELAQQPLRELHERLLKFLLPHIKSSASWVISPDSLLWALPWSALPLDDGGFLIENRRIEYTLTGRDLLPSAEPSPPRSAVIFADPDYDFGLANDVQGPFLRLPGTAEEAARVAPELNRIIGEKTIVHSGSAARETVVKSLNTPGVLLFSTHGFLADPKAAPSNPLAAWALALAGANRTYHSDDRQPDNQDFKEDGLLNGLEIVGIDLRGTDLVVLSACQTAVGRLSTGEGVAGLRRAFHLAGARHVAATLWSIPDQATAQLMSHFFADVRDSTRYSEALQAAQVSMIRSLRQQHGVANPFYWAAFTLSR